ncbi:hypothetical protein CH63R_05302 [Colletotrichum higginsianum IMI 349063]|uniref:Cyclin-dependent kinase n=2 Tax=Colletotrichum higginsianum (strain IMI 349063) TaxID=759273 RepID=A0A1B7YLT6_COLHI|nr:hypothetical protein CH63R_05302 [Colletotrichum higginsianum IMI 349063]OBR13006.1 hypothetical protein CH63R_05302 [Colletotrichum higginsianum IMI 349063]
MDSASIPPRLGHMHDPDRRQHFQMHPSAALQDAALLSEKPPRRALPDSSRPQPATASTDDALNSGPDAAPTSGDATANHLRPPHHHRTAVHDDRDRNHHNHNHNYQHPYQQLYQPVTQQRQQQQQQQQQQLQQHDAARTIDAQSTTKTPLVVTSAAADSDSHRDRPSSVSQDSTVSAETANVFTPPASQGDMPGGNPNGHTSSQESQLLQLSHIAAAQDKLAEDNVLATARKRMADGALKEHTSPVRMGHSRNTSTWSTDLKTRLSYAMLKVNHGWQSNSIDEVESMASQAASPASSHSTLHGRQDMSASPRANMARYVPTSAASAATTASSNPSPATYESFWKDTQRSAHNSTSPPAPAPAANAPTLAPPAPIQPSRPMANPRRNSNPRYTPTLLSHSHSASPHTPGQQNNNATPNQRLGRTPLIDPILFSPHQNVREQDAIESLIFMSSPGNSANMKNTYLSSMASNIPGRHALPSSQPPRKSLPSQRPLAQKRVGFERSPGGMTAVSDMDVDMDSPQSRGPVRRRINGSASFSAGTRPSTLRPQLSLPAALGSTSRPRPRLADADIERMIDQAAQAGDSSDDDDGEIQIPARSRQGGGPVGGPVGV